MDFIKQHSLKIVPIIGFIVILLTVIFTPKEETVPIDLFEGEETKEEAPVEYIYVDIKGEVKHPGVYKIAYPARLFQVIELAGGLTQDADNLAVNLARYLNDQEAIYIPNTTEDYPNISDPINEEETSQMININTASQAELEELNGVGPSTAQAIITYREEEGPFTTIEELLDVPGIGEATLEDLAPYIVV